MSADPNQPSQGGMFAPLPGARSPRAAGTAQAPTQRPKSAWVPIIPVPADAPPPPRRFKSLGEAVGVWEYRDADGRLIGAVARWQTAQGKEMRPLCYCRPADGPEGDGLAPGWRMQAMPEPRPLLGAHLLRDRPDAPVLIVEGETSFDAALRLAPRFLPITWPGGAKAIDKADWTPLAGRAVTLWPDADEAGRSAVDRIAAILAPLCPSVAIVTPPANASEGWDIADAERQGWTAAQVADLIVTAQPHAADGAAASEATSPAATAPRASPRRQRSQPTASPARQPENGNAPAGSGGNPDRPVFSRGDDVELAEHLAHTLPQAGGALSYDEGVFWQWDGQHWAQREEAAMRLLVHQLAGKPVLREGRNRETAVALGSNRVTGILKELGAITARPGFFAAAPPGVNTSSGFLRLAPDGTPELLPHDPEHRQRHTIAATWPPSASDAAALASFEASLLARYLNGLFRGDNAEADKLTALQEVAGVALFGMGTRLTEPRALVLYGPSAGNGKSQYLEMLRGMLPVDAVGSLSIPQMADEKHAVSLAGKLLNLSAEAPGSDAIASETLKSMITGDPLSVRAVYDKAQTLRPVAQHVFAANALPAFAGGMDAGVARRLLLLRFNRSIPAEERIAGIGARIAAEEPGLVLAWAVEGAARVLRQGGRFTISEPLQAELDAWAIDGDPVRGFLESGWLDFDPMQRATDAPKATALYDAFLDWGRSEGHRESKLPAIRNFTQRFEAAACAKAPFVTRATSRGTSRFHRVKIVKATADV